MDLMHNIEEMKAHLKLILKNLSYARKIRKKYVKTDNCITFRPARRSDLIKIKRLLETLFGMQLLPWLKKIYFFRCSELCSVAVDENDNLIGYDLYFFEPSEYSKKIIHELYIGVDENYQHKGIAVRLRQYSASCYEDGVITGISTLARHGNINALRSAQKAGFGILKESVKPRAYYMFKALKHR